MVAVLKYICGQSRRDWPVCSKYASTRRRSSRTKRSVPPNLRPARPAEGSRETGVAHAATADCSIGFKFNSPDCASYTSTDEKYIAIRLIIIRWIFRKVGLI